MIRASASRARTRPRPILIRPPPGMGGLRSKREESLNPTGCFAWQLPVIVASLCASDDAPWLFPEQVLSCKILLRAAVLRRGTLSAALLDEYDARAAAAPGPGLPHWRFPSRARRAGISPIPSHGAAPCGPSTRITQYSAFASSTLLLELHVLVRREWRHPHVGNGVLGDARTDAHQGAQIHDRRVHHPVDGELLDLVQQRLALFGVALVRLLAEQIVDVRIAAVGVVALGLHERLHPAGGVAGIARRGHEQAAQLLLLPGGVERRAFHLAQPHADADRVQIVHHRLGHGRKAWDRRELAGVDPVGISRLGSLAFSG